MPLDTIASVFLDIVREANKAPSVHNIQPTRWHLDNKNKTIELSLASDVSLPVADPSGRDVLLSCGAAAEGTIIALARHNVVVTSITSSAYNRFLLHLEDGITRSRDVEIINKRRTWRGLFEPTLQPNPLHLLKSMHTHDAVFIEDKKDLQQIARLNDSASLNFFRDEEFLDEIFSWMRFSNTHNRWFKDGLNADSMCMSRLEALAASVLLQPHMFRLMDRIGVSALMTSEASKVRSATAVALFYRQKVESTFEKGRAMYRFWLDITESGMLACPMASLSDTPEISEKLKAEFRISDDMDLVMILRIGPVKSGKQSFQSRLQPEELIV